MPYIKQPTWAKVTERILLLFAYAILALNGFLYFSVADLWWAGLGASLAATACIGGVITGYYRIEWVALGPLISMILVGTVAVAPQMLIWSLLFVVLAAVVLTRRLLHLTLLAKVLRDDND